MKTIASFVFLTCLSFCFDAVSVLGQSYDSSFLLPTTFTGSKPYFFWKAEHALAGSEQGDQDEDGISDLEEYYRGTDPTDPTVRPSSLEASYLEGKIRVTHRRSLSSQGMRWSLLAASQPDALQWEAVPLEEMEVMTQASQEWERIMIDLDPAAAPARFFKLALIETNAVPPEYDFGSWNPNADGITDDGPTFKAFFTQIKNQGGGKVTIPPGIYFIAVNATNQCPIPSDVEIDATGAEFHFSEDVAYATVFTWLYDVDVRNFIWRGGKFVGHAFDVDVVPHTLNPWPPNAHIRCVHIGTSSGGHTANVLFDGVTTEGIQGTAITVAGKWAANTYVDTYATNITLRGFHMRRSGPFLWDYGYLWQRLVWDYEYDENHRSLGATYLDPRVPQLAITLAEGNRIELNNSNLSIGVTVVDYFDQKVCFYGEKVDSSLIRGMAYCVVEADSDHIKISRTVRGAPIELTGDSVNMKVMTDLRRAITIMLHPYPGVSGEAAHGAYMVSAAVGVRAVDSRLEEGNGDAMLIHTSRDVLFSNNVIEGARMGAVWVGDRCDNVVVRNNFVDGGNGSRVLSVEKASSNVLIADNVFQNGGRGSWFNYPSGVVVSNNIFHPSTGKNTPDPYLGARSYQNGEYELWDQIYFTGNAALPYGPVTFVQNVVDSGTVNNRYDILRFGHGAHDVLISGNTFLGDSRLFHISSSVVNLTFGPNAGILTTNWGTFQLTVAEPTSTVAIPHGLADNSFYLTVVSSLMANNAHSAVQGVSATEEFLQVALANEVPAGTEVDIDWTAYLKWK